MNRASKNESASTSGSDREAPSEGSLKHTVLTSSLDSGSFSEISLMNCIMYKRANFILVNIYCGSGSAQSQARSKQISGGPARKWVWFVGGGPRGRVMGTYR